MEQQIAKLQDQVKQERQKALAKDFEHGGQVLIWKRCQRITFYSFILFTSQMSSMEAKIEQIQQECMTDRSKQEASLQAANHEIQQLRQEVLFLEHSLKERQDELNETQESNRQMQQQLSVVRRQVRDSHALQEHVEKLEEDIRNMVC
jgi:hypothetical protein